MNEGTNDLIVRDACFLIKEEPMNYTEQLEYLQQEETRSIKRLEKIYEVYSNKDWELSGYIYYNQPTGCDYPKCPRSNPKSGIKHVYRVRNRQTGQQLNLGSTCYLKLFLSKNEISNDEKVSFEQVIRKKNQEKKELEAQLEGFKKKHAEFMEQLKRIYTALTTQLAEYGISLAIDQFDNWSTNSYEENIRLAGKIEKYRVELEQLKKLEASELEKERLLQQAYQDEKERLNVKEILNQRKKGLAERYFLVPSELIDSYLSLVSHLNHPKVDFNGERYFDCDATFFSQVLNLEILSVVNMLRAMAEHRLIRVDNLRLYLLEDTSSEGLK